MIFGKKKDPVPAPVQIPQHVAVIMDGNGRWARSKMLPRVEGHRAGARTVRMIVEECCRLGIKYLTVYAFSTENWGRPREEVSALMKLFEQYLTKELELFVKHNVRLRAIGDRSKLSEPVLRALESAENLTRDNTAMEFILAVSYGGRDEIIQGVRRIAELAKRGVTEPEQITEESFRQFLFAPDVPDPDLLIRTSDEHRISNFLLWQVAYSEIVVTPVFWPDFSKDELHRCLNEYASRTRRFGLTEDQLPAQAQRS